MQNRPMQRIISTRVPENGVKPLWFSETFWGLTHRIVLESGHVCLNCSLHVSCCHQSCCQVDVSIDEVWFETERMAVMLDGLLKLTPFLVNIAQVRVGFSQHGVLFDGQSAKVGRPEELKFRKENKTDIFPSCATNTTPIPAVLNSNPRAPPLCIFRMLLLSLQMFILFERKCPAKWTSMWFRHDSSSKRTYIFHSKCIEVCKTWIKIVYIYRGKWCHTRPCVKTLRSANPWKNVPK